MNSFLGNKPISRENTLNIKEMEYGQKLKFNEKNWESSRSDEELTLEASAFQSLYGSQFTLSTQLIKPTYLVYIAR